MTQDLERRKATFRKLKALYAASIVAFATAVILITVQPMTWVRGTTALLLFCSAMVFNIVFWRCPVCGHHLENRVPKKVCPRCHKVLC
jgi:rubrerythrin